MVNDSVNKPNIAIATVPSNSDIVEGFLVDTVHILEPLSNKIYVITSRFPNKASENVHIIKMKSNFKKESVSVKILKFLPRFLLGQINVSYHLFRISKSVDAVIFFIGTNSYPLAILSAKLVGKKTLIISGGTISRYAKIDYGSFIVPHILTILENISFSLVDLIVVESENVIHFCGLEKYGNKITSHGASVMSIFKCRIKPR